MRRLGTLGWFLTWSLLFAPPAWAEPNATDHILELELEAPPGCPGRQALVDAVVKLVQTAAETPLEARVVIAERDGRFYADLAMLGGQRSFNGTTCRAVSEAMVVILALTIDPQASANTSAFDLADAAPEAEPVAQAAPETPAEDTKKPPPAPAIERQRPVDEGRTTEPPAAQGARLGGSAFLLGELGILPGPAVGALGLARVGRGNWRVEIGGGLLFPRSETLPSDANAGGELRWASAQLNGCIVPGEPFSLCLGAELGSVFGQGFGVDNERPGGATWAAGVSSWSARFGLGGDVAFEARLAVAVPALRPTFNLAGQFLHQPAAASGRILLGLAFR